jgi:hypothetical protein
MSPVKMFSHLRHHDKKAPKFSHLINITCCTFNMSPHKKISRLRSNKSWWQNNFFTCLIHFLYKNLKQFPQVSIHSVSKIQHSNGAVSSYRLISKVISESFTQQNNATSWCRGVVFLLRCRDCNQSVPTTWSLSLFHHNNQKIVLGGGQEAYPGRCMTCMSLHLATLACGSWLATSTGRALGGNLGSL